MYFIFVFASRARVRESGKVWLCRFSSFCVFPLKSEPPHFWDSFVDHRWEWGLPLTSVEVWVSPLGICFDLWCFSLFMLHPWIVNPNPWFYLTMVELETCIGLSMDVRGLSPHLEKASLKWRRRRSKDRCPFFAFLPPWMFIFNSSRQVTPSKWNLASHMFSRVFPCVVWPNRSILYARLLKLKPVSWFRRVCARLCVSSWVGPREV